MAQKVRTRLEWLEAMLRRRGRKPIRVDLFFDDGDYITDAKTGERHTKAEWERLYPAEDVIRLSWGDDDDDVGA